MRCATALALAGAAALFGQASEEAILARIDPPLRARPIEIALSGTALATLPTNLFEIQHRQIEDYLLREIAATPARRDQLWKDYPLDAEQRRARLAVMLGSVTPAGASETSLVAAWQDLRIEEIRVEVEGAHAAHGLVLIPQGGSPRKPALIVAGPEEVWVEAFAGIEEGRTPARWLTGLLARDVMVCLAVMVERTSDHPLSERPRASEQMPRKDRRHILHRLAFITGRTLTGIEADQIRALVSALSARADVDRARIGVLGRGQGGMTVLFAAALDPRIAVTGVSGYFSAREACWREPVDRMIYGQLTEFGDAELAALVAPRPLLVDTAHGTVEFERARRYFDRRQAADALRFVPGPFEALAAECARRLGAPEAAGGVAPAGRLSAVEVQARRRRHYEELLGFLRRRVEASDEARRRRWNLAATPPATRRAKAQELVAELARLVGEPPADGTPLNPRTRLIKVTDRYAAFDVLLDVVRGVEAYGQLLVPRARPGTRLPAVIAQHGLGGRPKDITLQGDRPDGIYHGIGARLAERGYVVFAPYMTVPIPQAELVNPLVRQAAALGKMRTAIELAKLRRIVDFLESLDFVDRGRIGYYGLSYGGYAAIWMGPLEPRLRATVVSGHFNDWRRKLTDETERTSYLLHPDEDFFNWDVLGRFTHVELLAAFYPRAVMVEFGLRDPTTFPDWHERAWREVCAVARAWGAEDRIVRDRFEGRHEIHGVGALEFLDSWLAPEKPAGRDYEYRLWPSLRGLPGIADPGPDTLPFVTQDLDSRPESVVRGSFPFSGPFAGLAFRVSRTGDPGSLVVRYGTAPAGAELGTARVAAADVHPLFDLWVEAPVPPQDLAPGSVVWFELRAEKGRAPADCFTVFGPRPLGGARLAGEFAPSFRPAGVRRPGREEPFEFMRRMLGPYAPEGLARLGGGRFELRTPRDGPPAAEQAADYLRRLLAASGAAIAAGGRRIELALEPAQRRDESFRLEIAPSGIRVVAGDARGLLRGVYELEDQFRLAGSLELPTRTLERRPRFALRITTAPVPGGDRLTETSRELLYTDGLLERISRDGFNGVWVWLNVEEAVTDSAVFPELNDPEAPLRLARLEALARRAARYGIDVWVYLATGYHRWMPAWFYERRPELRGQGWGNPLCISQRAAREFYAETVRRIFERAPGVAGLVVIYDSEGFFHCANDERNHSLCPRCRNRPREELTSELLKLIQEAMRAAGGPDKRLIAWNYGAETGWLDRLWPLLPGEILHQCDFSKGGLVERDGIRHHTGDYNLTLIGPPEHWLHQYRLTRKLGLEFVAKTEHAVSQEFIFVPYIPAMEQWLARIRKMREFSLAGWFGNWSHYGYTPSPPARLINRLSWDPEPAEPLEELARLYYGTESAAGVTEAWRRFSEAIREFPYSDHVARIPGPLQKGPSQPFFLDANVESFGRWRAWQNDLAWTRPWGPEVTAKYLRRVRDGFAEGAERLAQAPAAAGEYRIARTIVSALETTLNLIDWLRARERGAPVEELLEILERERANVEAILPVLDEDSRLGFASDGGGIVRGGLFTPELVRWKLGQLEDTMLRLRFGPARQTRHWDPRQPPPTK